MERTGSQKLLKGLSIFNIIISSLSMLFCGFIVAGGAMMTAGYSDAALTKALEPLAVTTTQAGPAFVVIGIVMLLVCIFEIVSGVFGVRAANDTTKIKPAWTFTLVSLIACGFMGLAAICGGKASISTIVSIALSALAFFAANNVKTEANI